MKILDYGDQHFYSYHQFSKPTKDALTIRLKEQIQSCKWISSLIRQYKPDIVVNNGDIHHTQGKVDTDVLMTSSKGLGLITDACKEIGAEHWIVVGNHDKVSDQAVFSHSIKQFGYWEGVKLFETPTMAEGIAIIPHMRGTSEDFMQTFQRIKSCDLAFCHLDIQGAVFHSTMEDKHGLSPKLFDNFKLVVNGHYHLPQNLKNIVMPGSVQEFSFREPKGDIEKGVLLIDTEKNETTRIPNLKSPKWYMFNEENLGDLKGITKNNYIHLTVTSKNILEEDGITSEYLNEFLGTEIVLDVERISPTGIKRSEEELEKQSEEEILSSFIDRCEGISDDDKENIKETGTNLIQKVR